MSGIGGVQTQFETFLTRTINEKTDFIHDLYTANKVDNCYKNARKKSKRFFLNLPVFLIKSKMKNTIVHSYNNLTSKKALFFFNVITFCKLSQAYLCRTIVTGSTTSPETLMQ